MTDDDRAQRIARITRDVLREAYPAPADPREPLIIGNPRPRSPVLVMRADFVALAEELVETQRLRAEVARLQAALATARALAMEEAANWVTGVHPYLASSIRKLAPMPPGLVAVPVEVWEQVKARDNFEVPE